MGMNSPTWTTELMTLSKRTRTPSRNRGLQNSTRQYVWRGRSQRPLSDREPRKLHVSQPHQRPRPEVNQRIPLPSPAFPAPGHQANSAQTSHKPPAPGSANPAIWENHQIFFLFPLRFPHRADNLIACV